MTTNYHTPYEDGLTTFTAADMNAPLSQLDTQISSISSYVVGNYFGSAPTSNQLILAHVFSSVGAILPENLTGSQARAEDAATAQTTFTIYRNTTQIGTMVFAAAATVATFTFSSEITFVQGQVLKVYAPSSPDATLARISISFVGTRT